MPANFWISPAALFAFLLVLARISGALAFIPLPGVSGSPAPARVVLALVLTLALAGRWPAVDDSSITIGKLALWAVAEAALGIALGVVVSLVLEAATFAAQVIGLQAGFGYASTLDPNTQADSGILLVIAQLFAGLLFFVLGLDREVLRLLSLSLDRIPAGAYIFGPASAPALIRLASGLFETGVRLAMPVVALLAMVDVALALLGRLNSQLQLLSLSFPAKMLAALLVFALLAESYPRVLYQYAGHAFSAARRVLGL